MASRFLTSLKMCLRSAIKKKEGNGMKAIKPKQNNRRKRTRECLLGIVRISWAETTETRPDMRADHEFKYDE